jgi:hypothetical protein
MLCTAGSTKEDSSLKAGSRHPPRLLRLFERIQAVHWAIVQVACSVFVPRQDQFPGLEPLRY